MNQGGEYPSQSRAKYGLVRELCRRLIDALPDDPNTLKAMLIAERDPQRTAAPDHQGIAAPSLRPTRRDVAGGSAAARARRGRADRGGRGGGSRGEDLPPQRARTAPRKRRANRGSLPAHLPRIETIVDIDDKTCPCCGGALHRIGEDVERAARRRAGAVPGARRASAQIRLPRLRGRGRAGARAGAADRGRPADRGDGRPGAGLQVCRPPCRSIARRRSTPARAIHLDRSTLADWVGRAAFQLRPVHERLLAHAAESSTKLFADETTAPVLDPGRGRTKTGQLWAYARDDRPWGGADPPASPMSMRPTARPSAADRASRRLQGRAAGRRLRRLSRAGREEATSALAFCWAHVRRRFYELAAAGPAPIASEALATHRPRSTPSRTTSAAAAPKSAAPSARRRADRSSTISSHGCAKSSALISQKTKLAEAIRYALSRWDGLTRFIDDGRIEIDSNVVERSIRPIALNRKNAFFAGSDGGGEHWAVIASLIETCKLNGVEPHAYLADVLAKIVNGHLNSQIDDLLPWAYVKTEPLKAVA